MLYHIIFDKYASEKNIHIFVTITAFIASFVVIIYFISKFISKNFGDVTIQQILLNIQMAEASNDLIGDYVKIALPFVFKCIFALVVIFYISRSVNKFETIGDLVNSYLLKVKSIVDRIPSFINERPQTIVLVLLLIVTVYAAKTIDRRLHIYDYISQENSTFIEDNYAKLDVKTAVFDNNKKKNLILLFAESIEKGYSDPVVYGENLIPELIELQAEGISLYGYRKTPGGYFTLDGISAQTLGMPITQVPFNIHDSKFDNTYGALLSKSPGIFNLLRESGYKTASFSGTSKNFTNKGKFLNVHGVDNTFFKEYWLDSGYSLDDQSRGFWDFNDIFLMERFKEYLSKNKVGEPFAVIFETVDTHFPNGWAPLGFRKDGGFKDAVRFSGIS